MKPPKWEEAQIPESKITNYLLDITHEKGKDKAAFFMQYGFTRENWKELATALKRHLEENKAPLPSQLPHGLSYTVTGPMRCPDGRIAYVKSAWFLQTGSENLRLVTAYPAKRLVESASTEKQIDTQDMSADMNTAPEEKQK